MPKEIARIWLKVTDVRVERLQDITEEQAEAEGCGGYQTEWKFSVSPCCHFMEVWDSTVNKRDAEYGQVISYLFLVSFMSVPPALHISATRCAPLAHLTGFIRPCIPITDTRTLILRWLNSFHDTRFWLAGGGRMRRKLRKAERQQVYEKCAGHCAYCGCGLEYKAMQVDHMKPLHIGGADAMANMSLNMLCVFSAVRFGLVRHMGDDVTFYFERCGEQESEGWLSKKWRSGTGQRKRCRECAGIHNGGRICLSGT